MKKLAVLSLSGGMDSSTLLLHLLAKGYKVLCLSFDYGQKHKVELDMAGELVGLLKRSGFEKDIEFKVIKIDGLSSILHSTLVDGGKDVPEGHYQEDSMKDTVVPNRNKIFSSIIQAAALSLSMKNKNSEVVIAMGIHSGDHSIYPDCRKEFRDIDYEAFLQGNWGAEKVTLATPYLENDKYGILLDGVTICRSLDISYREFYSRTNTSYKPIFIPNGPLDENGEATRTWYSDYKSSSSVERIEAFMKLGLPDPVKYADESGPVSWETVVDHVKTLVKK